MTVAGVPVVDLRDHRHPHRRAAFIEQVGGALRGYGFVRVTGHPVDGSLTEPAYAAARAFFALSEQQKRAYHVPGGAGERGYTPFGAEHARDSDQPDLKEFWHTGRELPPSHPRYQSYPPNQWPEAEVPGFRAAMLDLYGALEACAVVLLEATAEYLGLEPDHFSSITHCGNSILRALHYPPLRGLESRAPAVRAAAHEDINFITLLISSTASGLELLRRDGSWLPVNARAGELVADVGDMLARVTNGILPATTHRVVNPPEQDGARYSMPFFVHPRPDALLRVPEACRGPDLPEPPPAITGYAFLRQRLVELGLAEPS